MLFRLIKVEKNHPAENILSPVLPFQIFQSRARALYDVNKLLRNRLIATFSGLNLMEIEKEFQTLKKLYPVVLLPGQTCTLGKIVM